VAPPHHDAVLSDTADTAPTQRDRHIQTIAENRHALVMDVRLTAVNGPAKVPSGRITKGGTASLRYDRRLAA